jgi:hypothetical protein
VLKQKIIYNLLFYLANQLIALALEVGIRGVPGWMLFSWCVFLRDLVDVSGCVEMRRQIYEIIPEQGYFFSHFFYANGKGHLNGLFAMRYLCAVDGAFRAFIFGLYFYFVEIGPSRRAISLGRRFPAYATQPNRPNRY